MEGTVLQVKYMSSFLYVYFAQDTANKFIRSFIPNLNQDNTSWHRPYKLVYEIRRQHILQIQKGVIVIPPIQKKAPFDGHLRYQEMEVGRYLTPSLPSIATLSPYPYALL